MTWVWWIVPFIFHPIAMAPLVFNHKEWEFSKAIYHEKESFEQKQQKEKKEEKRRQKSKTSCQQSQKR